MVRCRFVPVFDGCDGTFLVVFDDRDGFRGGLDLLGIGAPPVANERGLRDRRAGQVGSV